MLVNRRIFLDEQVTRRHIGLGLVVVVVGDKILDRIVREKLAKFAVELRRQRLIRGQHQGRAPGVCDHLCHRKCLPRASDTEQGLERKTVVDAFHQLRDRCGLIARRVKRLVQFVRAVGKSANFHQASLARTLTKAVSRFVSTWRQAEEA